jgi:hypothetical protein
MKKYSTDLMDLSDLDQAWKEADAWFPEFQEKLLEPRIVSGWLGFPGSQLPRETAKIIGQPAQPARKKGASARYTVKDAILMRLGRTLTDMGITPHRVRACVERVRQDYETALCGYEYTWVDADSEEEMEGSFYIVGRETPKGFKVFMIAGDQLDLFITESGLAKVERRKALRKVQQTRMDTVLERKLSKPDYPKLASRERVEELARLAEEEYGVIDGIDPGSPAIVQNVTKYIGDQSVQLVRYLNAEKQG